MGVLLVRALRAICGLVALGSMLALIGSILIVAGLIEPGALDTESGVPGIQQATASYYWYGVAGGLGGLVLAGALGIWAHRYLLAHGY